MHLPAEAARLHLPWVCARRTRQSQGDDAIARRARAQSTRSERAPARLSPSSGDVRRGRISRRSTIALVLLGFVLVATGVIARRTYGIDQARALRDLDRRRQTLEAERVKLVGQIREASSRARLAPIAEQRLNMHVPSPDQVIMLARPRLPSRGGRPDSVTRP